MCVVALCEFCWFSFVNDSWCVYSEVVDKAGVDPLITLLNDVKPLVQANAAVCLTNLATEGNNITNFALNYKSWLSLRTFCPALSLDASFSRSCLAPVARHFSRAWHWCYISRPWNWLYVFPRRLQIFLGVYITFILIGQMWFPFVSPSIAELW